LHGKHGGYEKKKQGMKDVLETYYGKEAKGFAEKLI
jgi:hypothetical protein